MKKTIVEIIRVSVFVVVGLVVMAVGDFMRDGTFNIVENAVVVIIASIVSELIIYFINKAKKSKES